MGCGCGDGILGFGGLWGGACGGCGCNNCGCGDNKRIAVITAVRAVAAKGDGCFDGHFW
jgi:hypothetical protein